MTLPVTMQAAVLAGPGDADAFTLQTVPTPQPGPGDVLVRVRACGVSYRDIVERNGTYRRDVVFPLIIGLEIAGEVAALGEGVSDLKVGDRVCSKAFSACGQCKYCRSGRETTCRRRQPTRGGYAEYCCLPQDVWVRTPDDMPFETSCALGPGAGVALNAVRDTAHVQLGDTVLVTGATGGVGLPAVQIARLAGARVIALTRSEDKREALMTAGAHEVVVMAADGGFARAVKALTDGEGADVIIDTVGSRVWNEGYDSLALHGRYAFVGQLFGEDISINPARIFFKRAQLLGVGSVSRAQLADVIAMTASGGLKPLVGKILPLAEVAEAHRLVEKAAVIGRVVVTP
ncbi:quinone oxidoreductase family protein [Brevundimonas sp.]|uniref:quinone oxidoreductase family protein n=1 Tax=Brevundimonas sp. TaxID=1871086 RepID=UPI003BAA960D